MSERQQTKHHASPVANTPSNDSQQQLLVLDVFGAEELLSKTGQRKATDDCLDDDVLPPPVIHPKEKEKESKKCRRCGNGHLCSQTNKMKCHACQVFRLSLSQLDPGMSSLEH